jgi:hypothetical protein
LAGRAKRETMSLRAQVRPGWADEARKKRCHREEATGRRSDPGALGALRPQAHRDGHVAALRAAPRHDRVSWKPVQPVKQTRRAGGLPASDAPGSPRSLRSLAMTEVSWKPEADWRGAWVQAGSPLLLRRLHVARSLHDAPKRGVPLGELAHPVLDQHPRQPRGRHGRGLRGLVQSRLTRRFQTNSHHLRRPLRLCSGSTLRHRFSLRRHPSQIGVQASPGFPPRFDRRGENHSHHSQAPKTDRHGLLSPLRIAAGSRFLGLDAPARPRRSASPTTRSLSTTRSRPTTAP